MIRKLPEAESPLVGLEITSHDNAGREMVLQRALADPIDPQLAKVFMQRIQHVSPTRVSEPGAGSGLPVIVSEQLRQKFIVQSCVTAVKLPAFGSGVAQPDAKLVTIRKLLQSPRFVHCLEIHKSTSTRRTRLFGFQQSAPLEFKEARLRRIITDSIPRGAMRLGQKAGSVMANGWLCARWR